ncbi:hypothetical protein LR48_Vigan187s000700 [Vigna angularis]|uniref:Uncharacterized protein n=1 Tax=Phaseolus angularis TaxID=3914 RepID=A0A0L9T5A8_PHAAN|nr:hypothetical protein LR48_Vigan187s000700 [Vigna angularis]
MVAMRIACDVEDAQRRLRTSGWTTTKNTQTWGPSTGGGGIVAKTEPNRSNPTRMGMTESVGSVRKEANPINGTARGVSTVGSGVKGRGPRSLPYAEYIKRREEGRCFHCGGPYSPGHRCPKRSMRVRRKTKGKTRKKRRKNPWSFHISLPMLVLIDSRASHNFIARRMVEELNLPVEGTPPYKVCLGDGRRKEMQGCCEGVTVEMGR